MFCFAVGEWWMTHGPCTSEIKAVNIFINVCGSPDLLPHFISWGWLCIFMSVYVGSHTLNVKGPLEVSGPDLFSAGLTSKSSLFAQGPVRFL